ncbi:U3 small nucleolar RNA-associated protein 6-domain-containing protein [Staphylotrichum tortipilum]|uniref:U3 small nucleolar RNA-associated protein 6-domain-containing protein n=1 Tax=Staphylotrichum tortipilum TaxID=2831512 RepID=A0AAN6MPB1_9PEZI|nr:U3 small nucleolar RNA-associated protein 6-domain-containing protein [Staphylotrichum longicolle]
MAGVSDKARFYLERAAPELRSFEEKEIFSKEEIRSLVTKRSDYEHLVLAPGTKPTDFLSYIAWERSLDRLRAKRCRRLNLRSSSSHASHARTFGIFERAVGKHPGSLSLWRAYLDFAAQAKATKRWRRIAARALRLHPADAGLWALAGRRAAQAGDMERARAHFLRGCRFCTGEATLWVEYARCEMEWLARMEAKKGGKGVRKGVQPMEAIKATEAVQEGDIIRFDDDDEDDSGNEGELMLPDPDAEGLGTKPKPKVFDEEARRKMEQSPALSGAIPMAIFGIAQKQPFFSPAAAESFFDAFAAFSTVESQDKIVQHVLGAMEELFPNHPCTCSCQIRQPLIGVDVLTAAFPKALRESLARLKGAMERTDDKKALAGKMVEWVDTLVATDGLDAAIKTVLEHTKRSLEAQMA